MLEKMNIKGAKALNREELQSVNGGVTVTCIFPDGTSWEGNGSAGDALGMINHCHSSGGTFSIRNR
ncbi:hypothetical protein [Tenacibaculum agarivorans]|uniref:hypothetical protein n=1 Tax=Tenacibaculum agarivorans TaxID=1908389 RepID=UPI00094BAA4C|nr:hypothetical protein [Tenacibaculum agarivorans]